MIELTAKPRVMPLDLVSRVLSRKNRERLLAAAMVDPHAPIGDSFERTQALEAAIAVVRLTQPELFK